MLFRIVYEYRDAENTVVCFVSPVANKLYQVFQCFLVCVLEIYMEEIPYLPLRKFNVEIIFLYTACM